jgi:Phage gp6-like head-tail connector protein
MSITALRIVTAAAAYPITLSEVKGHLRVTHNAEDSHIQRLIAAATDWAQQYTRRIFVNTQVIVRLDRFPVAGDSVELVGDTTGQWFYFRPYMGRKKDAAKRVRGILLPGGKVTAINAIDYTDTDGNPQTLSGPTSGTPGTDYQEDISDDEWAFVYPAANTNWPDVDTGEVNAVQIDYQLGWATGDDVPESICQSIAFKVADMFTIRDTIDAGSKSELLKVAETLLEPWVVPHF